ncbi:MAG: M48 family metallopeptidase [Bacteroidetes bacterium]|nr:M48 family metallopeptidase [Bacteroidota bacterium]MCB0842636.1 M48 family metallopeptidase [Bacteroidota bacterium]
MREEIHFGSKKIDFTLIYSDRKTLGITVSPEMEVLVKAPLETSLEQVKVKVHKRAPWILKQLDYFLSFQPRSVPKKFISGETHLYLGRQYRLKVSLSEKKSIKLKGKFIEVSTPELNQTELIVKNWYLKNAERKFREYAEPLITAFQKYDVKPEEIILRNMPTRWGSCTPKGKIILNPELIKAPKGCIEYVIIHELCHLIHHNHNSDFLALQTREMQEWEKWKNRLENLLA